MPNAVPDPVAPAPSSTLAPAAVALTEPQERLVVTEHRLTLGKRRLDYQVTCGTIVLRDHNPVADPRRLLFQRGIGAGA